MKTSGAKSNCSGLTLIEVLLVVLIVIANTASAGLLGNGIYRGYFYTDRWGQKELFAGPIHLFVSDDVAEILKSHTSKLLAVDVTNMYQPMNPGGGVIYGVGKVTELEPPRLAVNARILSSKVRLKEGVKLQIRVQNNSTNEVELGPGSPLSVVLVTQKPFSNGAINYPGDMAFWYHQTEVRPRDSTSWLMTACRVIELPWSPQDYIMHSEKVIIGEQKPTFLSPGVYKPLVIMPGGRFEIEATVGQELLAGQYEVFVFYGGDYGGDFYGPMSKRIAFDVIESDSK